MNDGGVYTIFDTAAKDIMISDLWYESFVGALMEVAGVKDYEQKNGQLFAKCTSNFPNLYFLVNGYWLVVPPEHYKLETSTNNLCRLRFAGLDAGFNIFGLPIYLDYYVSHYWGESGDIMAFTPIIDTDKPSIKKGETPDAENAFSLKMETEAGKDLSNDGIYIGLGAAVVCLAIFGYFFYTWIDKKTFGTGALIGLGFAGVAGAAAIFFIVWWLIMTQYEPEVDKVWPVKPADEVRVNAGHVTFLAVISFGLYKLCGKKQQETVQVESTPSLEQEISSFVNSLE